MTPQFSEILKRALSQLKWIAERSHCPVSSDKADEIMSDLRRCEIVDDLAANIRRRFGHDMREGAAHNYLVRFFNEVRPDHYSEPAAVQSALAQEGE